MAPYEKLHAWRECHALALSVYRATKQFPTEERYGLTSQTRRAAFSAAVNIVEGSSREAWTALNDQQCRARYLTWQLYRSLAR